MQPAPGQERSYGDWVQNNLGGQDLDGVNVQAGSDGGPQYVWTQNNPDGSSTEHTATSAHPGPDGQLIYQDGDGQAVSASGKPAFVDGNGNGWVQSGYDPTTGETFWNGSQDGKDVTIATGELADGRTYIRQNGNYYIYDHNGNLVSESHLDPGQALERPLGYDVATAAVGIWPAMPPGLKAAVLDGLQDLASNETPGQVKPGGSGFGQTAGSLPAQTQPTADWPELSGLLRDAANGKGNFGIGNGSYTPEQASALGQAWVGPGARLSSDGKAWVSADGLRQWRPPSYKPNLGKWQSNYEWRGPKAPDGSMSSQWQGNAHLDVDGD
ncbi:hypothetical protein [Gordonia sp. N1V]|uniref:hypothetical protein n=1 Tax=Gordonia sp. N1V TaxID=3034163 RepID=UPI0023E0A492|nr:hypothetical protein [Gordonia sp. N1V]MDF3284975.1 hypothetical protein [Gordonia sp. N1V]